MDENRYLCWLRKTNQEETLSKKIFKKRAICIIPQSCLVVWHIFILVKSILTAMENLPYTCKTRFQIR